MSQGFRLETLNLNNFATFENQNINFNQGFNAIIGETGSGKSLIIDALQLLFGGRADKKVIRKDAQFSTVEAHFSTNDDLIREFFNELGFPFDTTIIIKRVIFRNGQNKNFLNYQQTNLSTLQSVFRKFIDLVGQFDNQKLLSEDYQLLLVDEFAGNFPILNEYRSIFNKVKNIEREITTLQLKKQEKQQREDYLRFQLNDIHSLNPSVQDEEELIKLKDKLLCHERKITAINKSQHILSESDNNIISSLSSLYKELAEYDEHLQNSEILKGISNSKLILEEVSYALAKEDNNEKEHDLDQVMSRLDKYQKIKKRFQVDTKELCSIQDRLQQELFDLEQIDIQLESKLKDFDSYSTMAHELAIKLHHNRISAAAIISEKMTIAVQELNMEGSTLNVQLNQIETLTENGASQLTILAETNKGEGFFPLKDIASGGELSRFLLCFRQILSTNDSISIFIFDEIDTGIGGETALKIGKALHNVSINSQVLAITHLPQIASHAENLILVEKFTEQDRTFSKVENIRREDYGKTIESMAPIA